MKNEDIKTDRLLILTLKLMQLRKDVNRLEELIDKLNALTDEVNAYVILVNTKREDIEKEIINCGFKSVEEFEKFKGFDE